MTSGDKIPRVVLTLVSRRAARPAATCLLAALLALPACGPSDGSAGGRVTVIASFYPLAEAAERVGGDLVSVTDLTVPGVEPHDLELTPRQLAEISTADVVLYLGGGFQPAVQDAIGDARGRTVDVGRGLPRLPVPPDGSGASLAQDPHVWLDPVLFGQIVDRIASTFAQVDRGGRATFSSNASVFDERLQQLNREYRAGLSGCARDVIVTTHAAFGYLAARYGLRQEPISGLSPESEPTPGRLADLRAFVEREGVTTIFTEPLVSAKVAETLARETGTTTAVLDPIENLTPEQVASGQDYLSLMRSNLAELEVALGCR